MTTTTKLDNSATGQFEFGCCDTRLVRDRLPTRSVLMQVLEKLVRGLRYCASKASLGSTLFPRSWATDWVNWQINKAKATTGIANFDFIFYAHGLVGETTRV